ncbi:MAG TPA: DISARM system phospholipase D-like protein DrmC [Planctomycetota bacterium]|jgi:phosphatidylserine/phosphatidylglycerophosphate/cardiolipin synthase-like enzyme|nr:DISARM system phospholipase D-like protein DrmC [Planctomycetota bacterium]
MMEYLFELPSHLRDRLADALEAGLVDLSSSPVSVGSALGDVSGVEGVAGALREFQCLGVSPSAAAALIRAAGKTAARVRRPDLVWSGPEVPGLHARQTRRVYEELLGSAERSLWISTFVFFDGPRAFEVLARRMEAKPGLQVTLLMNIQRRKGELGPPGDLVRRFADRFWTSDWPGARRPRVFYDPRALDAEGPGGVLHAKAVLADEETVFVTSANLTEAALERNIELGLLVRDRALAITLGTHFQTLIERSVLLPLPMV